MPSNWPQDHTIIGRRRSLPRKQHTPLPDRATRIAQSVAGARCEGLSAGPAAQPRGHWVTRAPTRPTGTTCSDGRSTELAVRR
ncbi:hypothetical protein RHA1_ro00494 [Rhodococcus jostii RHA1]|uniref:Uncharacterized protein n=1 Tax=Rhodococcus jostii (strain RHA1) TaxID=101510 RepID=Q0SJF6_RHOJR|nr:hypothetical protein RHA1_ro00494 [Rhodococcus jostii RHA1]